MTTAIAIYLLCGVAEWLAWTTYKGWRSYKEMASNARDEVSWNFGVRMSVWLLLAGFAMFEILFWPYAIYLTVKEWRN